MNMKKKLLYLAAGTAVVCVVILLFFRTSVYTDILKRGAGILMPFIYGAVIAYLLCPVSAWIERGSMKLLKGFGERHTNLVRLLSVLAAVLLFLVLLILLLVLVLPEVSASISALIAKLPQAMAGFEDWVAHLDQGSMSHELVVQIQNAAETLSGYVSGFLESDLQPAIQSVLKDVSSSIQELLGVIKNFGLGCIAAIYLMISREKFLHQAKLLVYAVFPEKTAEWIEREVKLTDWMFSGFVQGKILDSFVIGVICFVFMVLTGLPDAMLISVIVGVTNVIPFFGPYLGAIPSALLLLMRSPVQCIIFLIFIIVLQQFDGNVLGPAILGDRLGISAFWIMFSIIVFGALWGLPGMLVGAPVFAVLYDLAGKSIFTGLKKKGLDGMAQEYEARFGSKAPEKDRGGRKRKKKAERGGDA